VFLVTSSTNVNAPELSSDLKTTSKLWRSWEAVSKRLLLLGSGVLIITLTVVVRAGGADPDVGVPVNESTIAGYDWTGPYVGAHVGYATGSSKWSATQGASPNLTGSLSFYKGFDFAKGTGSFFGGLQGGYNYSLPSHLVVGVEGDVSFPNTIRGNQTISSASIGEANYDETVQYFGTVRGRIGYAFNNWLVYGTSGLAWTYDQFTRAQLVGTPAGGTAIPGTNESSLRWRTGWTVGAGVEVALAPNWSTKLEYLFTDFGITRVTFPAGAQRIASDLDMHEVRLGVNYNFGEGAANWQDFTTDYFSIHGQTTFVNQYAFKFRAPYHGPNSLDSNAGRQTWDATLYAGLRLWQGAELWINPEIDQGFGLSGTLGVAGFPSGEAYKFGANYPYVRLQRMFIRQTIGLGGETEKVEPGLNQFGGSWSANRLIITFGKFAVTDIFDTNRYAHDPRIDFLNWAIVDTGTFDYAADAWAYTYGTALEWYLNRWTLRAGVFDLSITPNSTELDPGFRQFQLVLEVERRYDLWGQPGKLALTGFLSRGRMGRYQDAVQLAASTGGPADIAAVRRYTSRGGISFNAEQRVLPDLGLFARAGIASGDVEPYEFTDVDRTIATGLSLSGERWGRPDDTVGFGGVINGISSAHQAFLNAGGLGILVGDGKLPHPGLEKIIETYYSFALSSWRATLDYQFIANPAYNRDRGPVSVIGVRLHSQF
jgi:high affinity Mn2+ porin